MNIKQTIPDRPAMVNVDRDALEQIFLNLIDNAIKYAAEGKEIEFKLTPFPSFYEMRIMDRGPGVPLKQRKKIFEKFHRVDDSLTAQQAGSGLGLSIAKRLLNDMGGDIKYEPREDGGSCFVIKLPI
jgi:signal transduction histidine kinase